MKKKDIIIVLCALVIASFFVWYGNYVRQDNRLAPEIRPEQPENNMPIEAVFSLGNETAPVVIEVFSTYGCFFCARYYVDTIEQFITEYVNTGKVRLVYHHFDFIDPARDMDVSLATQATFCANDQNASWEYKDKLFAVLMTDEAIRANEQEYLIQIAQNLNLNVADFRNCLESQKHLELIRSKSRDIMDRGINSTPATFLNGEMIVGADGNNLGAMPFSMLQERIEAVLP